MLKSFTISNMSDILEIEKIPLKERVTELSTFELIEKGASINPDAIAISFLVNGDAYQQPIQISYKEFIGKLRQTANMLYSLGIGSTDVVSYILPNLPQTHYTLWGTEAVGIVNPINPLLEASTIKDICNAANTKIIVALGIYPGSDIWRKVEAIRDSIPSLKYIIRVMGMSDESKNIFGFDEKISQYPSDHFIFQRQITPNDIASIYHTGGTTGRPKLAKRTHYNEMVVAWDLAVGTDLHAGESVMVGLPLFHCNGTCATGLMPFSVGGQVVLLSPSGYRDASIMANFYRIVEKYRPVFFSCVPTILSVLLNIPKDKTDISSLRYVVCGAAPLSVELFNRFEKHTGIKILEGYGLTESAVASALNPKDGNRKIGSIGLRLPYQQVKVVIFDEEGNYVRDANTNEIGVICIQGPCVFKGYVESVHNKGIWIQDDWFITGDMGRQDEDGYFWLTGRRKDLIIRGGHNIDPASIEEPLYKMPQINMVAAVGKPDAHAGEIPVAYVELAKDSAINSDEIMEWAKKNIGERAAVPKEIIIIDKIPLTAVGKIFKPALRWDATERAYKTELKALGDLVTKIDVNVGEDKRYGTLAKIQIHATQGVQASTIEAIVNEKLGSYPVRYEVSIIS
ncbi:MAG: acyl-CoA synthetase [Desulfobacterales bacterium]|nr:acyl-CoA synthetase [Desulfobacterales bacterium]